MMSWLIVPLLGLHFSVVAEVETDPSPYPGDSVDDPVIWYNEASPTDSLILTTLKASNLKPVQPTGILVYNLDGSQREFLKDGTPNNIDARTGFKQGGETFTLIAASHWYSNKVGLYRINPNDLKLSLIKKFDTSLTRLRGLCMSEDSGDYFYYAISENGEVEQYKIAPDLQSVQLVGSRKLESSAEGCVVDDEQMQLYIAEERLGIWKFPSNLAQKSEAKLIATTGISGTLRRDIEGLELVRTGPDQGYLIASSQGASEIVVYDRMTNDFIASFDITDGDGVDRVTETDGIAVTTKSLGKRFPQGVFIAQDNDNQTGGLSKNQNFKLVPLQSILENLSRLKDE